MEVGLNCWTGEMVAVPLSEIEMLTKSLTVPSRVPMSVQFFMMNLSVLGLCGHRELNPVTAQLLVRRATCVGADAAGVLSVIMRVRMLARVTAIVVRWVSGHCSSLLLGTQPIAGSLVDGDRASARGDNDVVTGQVVRELLVFEDRIVHGQRLPVNWRRGSVRRGADGVGRSCFARLDTSVNVLPEPTR